jgi:hypothetical protein
MSRTLVRTALLGAAAVALIAGSVCAEAVRHVQVIDEDGARIVTRVGPTEAAPPDQQLPRDGVIWHYNDPAGVIQSCVLSDLTFETWLGVNQNVQRLMYFETLGDGTPVYEHPVSGASLVTVGSAESASLVAVLTEKNDRVGVAAFSGADGSAPIWGHDFDPLYNGATHFGVDVSADGAIVAAVGFQRYSPYHSKLVILDGATGAVLNELPYDFSATAVELSDDGTRAVLTAGANVVVYEIPALTQLHTFSVSGSGGVARISRNGEVVAAGGFNARAFRDTGSGWVQVHSQQESTQWYGGMAIAGDGNTLFAGSRNYSNETITLRIIDLVANVETGRYVSTPTGSYQDVITRAEVSMDGSLIAVATWGQETRPHPEVMVFDRYANMIGHIAMPGSAWTLDLTANGLFLVAGGKNVHANQFGMGGDAYVYETTAVVPIEELEPEIPGGAVPAAFNLAPNFPNPFNPFTNIAFSLPRAEHVRLDIFDARGRLVRTLANDRFAQGEHTVLWNGVDQNGRSVSSGTYYCRLQSDSGVRSRTLMLVK